MENYGADGVRVGMLLTSPAGNDLPFDESLCEQGRNFSNKIWNAMRLIKGWEVDANAMPTDVANEADEWFKAKFAKVATEVEDLFSKFRLSEALMAIYKLAWDDFCSWYLEMIKPEYGSPIDGPTLEKAIAHFEQVLKLMHPFMPFITEEIWHILRDREEEACITVSTWPEVAQPDSKLVTDFEKTMEVITNVRTFRAKQNLPNKEKVTVLVKANEDVVKSLDAVIVKLANTEAIEYVDAKPEGAYGFMVGSNEYFIPLAGTIDLEAEMEKLKTELEYTQGFLKSVAKKLSNERFVNNAPEQVVENERKKQADAEAKIKVLEQQLAELG